jgi:hypothetical protein
MLDKIEKFSLGERRLLRRETAVRDGDTDYFLLPGTAVAVCSCREEDSPGGRRIVYEMCASITELRTGHVEEVKFDMTQRELQRHTRVEEIHDDPPSRAHEEPAIGPEVDG